jgi:SAM-dependent methyltransferase
MSAPAPLTDREALAQHRLRAERQGAATFLHDLAADEIEERLAEVNRRFTDIAVVTGHPAVWRAQFPAAKVVPDDDILDLVPGAHDLVIHALALHWANDPVGQLVQARRALRPDGLLLCVSFGGQTLAELRAALAEAEVALTGRPVAPRPADGRDPGPWRAPPARGARSAGGRQSDAGGDLREPDRAPPRSPRDGRDERDGGTAAGARRGGFS